MPTTSRAGASVVLAALFVSVVVAACGTRGEPSPAPLPLDLPVVGTVGDLPPEDDRLTIQVTRSGHIRVPGRDEALSLEGLRAWLLEQTDRPEARGPAGYSLCTAHLEIDAGTPWLGVQWIMQACADPAVQIWKLSFAARTPDGATGAIAVTLPGDRGPRPTPLELPAYHTVKVFQRDGGPASGLGVLAARLAALPKDTSGLGPVFDIVAPPPIGGRVAYGTILRIMDAALAADARFIGFEGAAIMHGDEVFTDADGFADRMMSERAQRGVPRFRIGSGASAFLPPDAPGAAEPTGRGRIQGRHGTALDDWPVMHEIVLDEDLEEVEEDDR